MGTSQDQLPERALSELRARLREAQTRGGGLRIVGGNTRSRYWRTAAISECRTNDLRGIVAWEPSELVVTVRAGTPLAELEAELATRGQRLGSEPPRLGSGATVGGAVASGFSGPARPWSGALRDALLGVRMMDAAGEVLRFGGQVIKNVAGYDVSRLCAGAWGRLGILIDVSFRLAPAPPCTRTLRWRCEADAALVRMTALGRESLPVTGCVHVDGMLNLRLAGSEAAVDAATRKLQADTCDDSPTFWDAWRDQRHAFFAGAAALWRVEVPPATASLAVAGECAMDWGGGLRWYRDVADPAALRRVVAGQHGFALPWGTPETSRLPAGEPGALMRRVIASFDPGGLFNPASV